MFCSFLGLFVLFLFLSSFFKRMCIYFNFILVGGWEGGGRIRGVIKRHWFDVLMF